MIRAKHRIFSLETNCLEIKKIKSLFEIISFLIITKIVQDYHSILQEIIKALGVTLNVIFSLKKLQIVVASNSNACCKQYQKYDQKENF